MDQNAFIQPNGLFSILTDDKKIIEIQDYEVIAGYFNQHSFTCVLEDPQTINAIKNNFCIATSPEHACELSYSNNQWHFYDSVAKEIFSYNHLYELANKVLTVLGITLHSYYLLQKNQKKIHMKNRCHIIKRV